MVPKFRNINFKALIASLLTSVNDLSLTIIARKLLGKNIDPVNNTELENSYTSKNNKIYLKTNVKTPLITYMLIVINILISLIIYIYSTHENINYYDSLSEFGAKENLKIILGEYWRFLTPVFLHADITHLVLNCVSIYILGYFIEKFFGHAKFLIIYLVAGVLGNIASFSFMTSPGIGASGAIFGLFGSLLFFILKKPAFFRTSLGYSLTIVLILNLFYGFLSTGADNYAHLGGLIGGFLISGTISKSQKPKWYINKYLYFVIVLFITLSGLIYGFHQKI